MTAAHHLREAARLVNEIIDYCDENMHQTPCPQNCHKCGMLSHLKQQAEACIAEIESAMDDAVRYTASSGMGYPDPGRVSSIDPTGVDNARG